ncbi:MAG: hypothetical protein AM1032_000015 [Mycoplasmataceae bacterium]|nr:MAG: hypothetical protein AM1032_000015 [Mycoplasmataceae bacterium]
MTDLKKINISSIISARNFLHDIVRDAKSDYEKAGAIQAFEVCYELAWHLCQKVLFLRNINVFSHKETFRTSALEGLIKNPEEWFSFDKKRNLTTHTYDGKIALEIIEYLPQFIKELDELIFNLKGI